MDSAKKSRQAAIVIASVVADDQRRAVDEDAGKTSSTNLQRAGLLLGKGTASAVQRRGVTMPLNSTARRGIAHIKCRGAHLGTYLRSQLGLVE